MSADINWVIREALSQGWQHDRTTRGHHQFFAPNGQDIVTTSGTPSDYRAFRNFLSDMKKRGFVMPIDGKRIKYGAAKRELLAYLKRHEGKEVLKADLRAYLRSVLPGISSVTIHKNLRALETAEGVTNTPIGMIYRSITWTTTAPVVQTIVQPNPEPPKATLVQTPTIGSDLEEQELDEALEALAKIERIIRRHKEIARYLARIAREIES
jgi:hypothetical protein